jgi:hypothetical protein
MDDLLADYAVCFYWLFLAGAERPGVRHVVAFLFMLLACLALAGLLVLGLLARAGIPLS